MKGSDCSRRFAPGAICSDEFECKSLFHVGAFGKGWVVYIAALNEELRQLREAYHKRGFAPLAHILELCNSALSSLFDILYSRARLFVLDPSRLDKRTRARPRLERICKPRQFFVSDGAEIEVLDREVAPLFVVIVLRAFGSQDSGVSCVKLRPI